MLQLVLIGIVPFLLFLYDGTGRGPAPSRQDSGTGTLRKMVPTGGEVTLHLEPGSPISSSRRGEIRDTTFSLSPDAFLPVLVFNNEVRTPLPGSLPLIGNSSLLRGARVSRSGLVLEALQWGSDHEMVIRDASGIVLFNVDGLQYEFDASADVFHFDNARLSVSTDYASELGRPKLAGTIVGSLSLRADMRAIEITNMVDGEVQSDILPASPDAGTTPGPDVIVGDLNSLSQPQAGSVGGLVGLSVGTDSCNVGNVDLDWYALPSNNHPVIPQNLYRMSGGPNNDLRFEQIGQSSVKHAFQALTENICGLNCNGVGGSQLGSGCSDPYVVSLNSGGVTHSLGSRAWINPFTGAFPRSDSATPPNSHTGHVHNATSHRILVDVNDLNTNLNAGATYFAEAQYITPHEYAWCQAHPGECNMYNNVSHRQYLVAGTSEPFSFPASNFSTVREKPAISEWAGSSSSRVDPAPGTDGTGIAAWKVTNPSPGVWHYEYAIYNQNLDRSIQSLALPVGVPVSLSNIGFHAPPQQPGSMADGTLNSLGFSGTPWGSTRNAGNFVWSTETFAQNPNANAIRWGTLYNFRFDSNYGPTTRAITVGFFKTGSPITVPMEVPTALVTVSGRVLAGGRGVTNARVSIQADNGSLISTTTDRRGRFTLSNVPSGGGPFTVTAVQRRFQFAPQTIAVNDAVSGVLISAL